MKKALLLTITALLVGSTSVMAIEAKDTNKTVVKEVKTVSKNGSKIFKKCAGCHGVHGEKKALGKSKIIAKFEKKDIIKALKGYKEGTYGGKMKMVMKGQASSLKEEEINDVAEYISTLKK